MTKFALQLESERTLELLREIDSTPELAQRHLAQKCNISLCKTNFLLKSLLENGMIKVYNFKNSKNKRAYIYMLTPEGTKTVFELMHKFCECKAREYERLKHDIKEFGQAHKETLQAVDRVARVSR